MTTKDFSFTLTLSILSLTSFAENDVLTWVKQQGGSSYEYVKSIDIDASGNVYTIGSFEQTIDLDPSERVFNLTPIGEDDIYISKLDAAGNFVWAKQFGGKLDEYASSITIDQSGYLYIIGNFLDVTDFDPGVGTYNLTSKGECDIFICKLDPSGNFVWAKQIGGITSDYGGSLVVDSLNNIYITASFSKKIDTDPGDGIVELNSNGSLDALVCKLDSNGTLQWTRQFGGIATDWGGSITLDRYGHLYTVGTFRDFVDFDPGAGACNLFSIGEQSIYISKFDTSGNFIWAKKQSGTGSIQWDEIETDMLGNIYIDGSFNGTIDFDPGPNTYNMYTESTGYNGYISKIGPSGNFIWAKRIAGHSNCLSLAVDSLGYSYITGYFAGSCNFDQWQWGYLRNSINKSDDGFILKLNPSGKIVWAKQVGGIESDLVASITIDKYGSIYTAGHFTNTVDFDFGPKTYQLTSMGKPDIFIHKMSSCQTVLNISHPICDNTYLSPSGKYKWDKSGTYMDTISHPSECDSVFVINLELIDLDTSISIDSRSLKVNTTDAIYQWLYGNFTPITGETHQNYAPLTNGNYYVIVQKDGCIDTSECYSINNLKEQEISFSNRLSAYPNPTTRSFDVKLGEFFMTVSVTVNNSFGQVLSTNTYFYTDILNLNIEGPTGVYYLKITTDQGSSALLKVLKH